MTIYRTICCINEKRAIGEGNKLLYDIEDDMNHFKATTTGNIVIMGKNTLLSLPRQKPLKNRINIISTTDERIQVDGKDNHTANSIKQAKDICEKLYPNTDAYIIGGESIYRQFLEQGLVDEQLITLVLDDKEGDSHYPEDYDNNNKWETAYKSDMIHDTKNNLDYHFITLKKKN